jgi:hypothetical protein
MKLLTEAQITKIVSQRADFISETSARKLLEVMNRILEEPKRLDMMDWGIHYSPSALRRAKNPDVEDFFRVPEERNIPPCGTVGCLAGWTLVTLTPKRQFDQLLKSGNARRNPRKDALIFPSDTASLAAELLGISKDYLTSLFAPGMWPQQFREGFLPTVAPGRRALVTRNRVIYFIKTGE